MVQQLTQRDWAVLKGMPYNARRIIASEWMDPESKDQVLRILRSADPTKALASEISGQIRGEVRYAALLGVVDVPPPDGMGELEGLFKSVKRTVSRVRKKTKAVFRKVPGGKNILNIHRKVREVAKRVGTKGKQYIKRVRASKIGQRMSKIRKITDKIVTLGMSEKKYRDKFKAKIRPYIGPIVGIVGGVLAPFTFGLSAVGATLVTTGMKIAEARKAAKQAEREHKADAAEMAAEVAAAEKEYMAELEEFYNENEDVFAANSIGRSVWNGMDIEAKLGAIEMIASGDVPPVTPPAPPAGAVPPYPGCKYVPGMPTAEEEAALVRYGYTVVKASGVYWLCPKDAAKPPAPEPEPEPEPKPEPAPAPSILGDKPPYPAPAGQRWEKRPASRQPDAPMVWRPVPDTPPPTWMKGPESTGNFDLVVEGQRTGSAPDLKKISELAGAQTRVGSRFEIFKDGKSTGLKVRGSKGPLPIPADHADQVRAMTPEQSEAMVKKVEEAAAKKDGIPWGLIVGAVAAGTVALVA